MKTSISNAKERILMAIGDICKRDVAFAVRDTTVDAAAKLMRQYHVGSLVVIDPDDLSRRPVGIVTDRDLVLEVYALNLDPNAITIGDIMTEELVTVPESFGVMETTKLMGKKGIRRVPVVDHEGNLAGIVTIDDVLVVLADELNDVARAVTHEQSREVRMRA
jgi:CBS domain-containing protein